MLLDRIVIVRDARIAANGAEGVSACKTAGRRSVERESRSSVASPRERWSERRVVEAHGQIVALTASVKLSVKLAFGSRLQAWTHTEAPATSAGSLPDAM